MDESALGPVVELSTADGFGYGFRIQKPGKGIRHPVTLVFKTEQDAKDAREAMRVVIDKAISVLEAR